MRVNLGLLIVCLVAAGHSLQAQESVTQETNAPSIQWYQVQTPHFKILYPAGFEQQAQRVANNLEMIREPEGRTMGTPSGRIPIILQNQSARSNGFVTMAPWRSEFFTMPPQNYNFIGNSEWLNLLSSHEYRHMSQFQRSQRGFNKLVRYVLGQQAAAGFAFAAAPQWFWEGDAVATETAFTSAGRGRIPHFDLVFKTNILEGRTFNYHKQYLRSFKHNIPDHYVLGYNMVSHLRKRTGDPLVWEKVAGDAWAIPFIPFTFSNSLKKHSGKYVSDLYLEMAAEKKKEYEKALEGIQLTPFETLTKRKDKAYADYLYPQPLDNGNVVVMKSGIGDIEQLIEISPDGAEVKQFTPGIINDAGQITSAGRKVVWNEYHFDPRWRVHTYSVVKGYDFGNGTLRVISEKTRYTSAAISPDGYKVATIESGNDYQTRIVLLDYFSGKAEKTFDNPNNDQFSMLRWVSPDKLVALRVNAAGKAVIQLNTTTGAITELIPPSQENIGYPVMAGEYLLFNSPISGIDNIYALHIPSGKRFQITQSRLGAYNPAVSPDGSYLYYNDQSANGLDLVRTPFNPAAWTPASAPADAPAVNSYQHLVEQEGAGDIFKEVPTQQYPVKRYHRAAGMINPHSWGPYLVNSLTRINLGVTSQDILSTTALNVGYIYDINEKTGYWRAGFSYQGFFPVIDVNFISSLRSSTETFEFLHIDSVQVAPVQLDSSYVIRDVKFTWKEQTIEAGLRIPLVTTRSRFVGSFTVANYVGATQVSSFVNSLGNSSRFIPYVERSGPSTPTTPSPSDKIYYPLRSYQNNGQLIYNHFSISTYRLLKQSRRDINSKWGQVIDLDLFNTPYGGNFSGNQFSFTTTLYFPGLMKHHSFWGYWAYQYVDLNFDVANYTFRNQVPLPRGQTVFQAKDFYSMSANYTFPIWYPDIAIGPLLNVQRFRGNLFMDYGAGGPRLPGLVTARSYLSIGAELKVDFNVMRFLPQFSAMVRYSRGISPSTSVVEIALGTFTF